MQTKRRYTRRERTGRAAWSRQRSTTNLVNMQGELHMNHTALGGGELMHHKAAHGNHVSTLALANILRDE